MAWATPSSRATDDVIAAATWNQDVVDNPAFLHDPPCCRVYNSANISIPDSTNTALTFNSERYDTDTMHSTAVNTGRITFTTAGKYHVATSLTFAANSSGVRLAFIRLNGATTIARHSHPGDTGDLSFGTDYSFAAADYVEVLVYQTSSGALNVSAAGNYSPEFSARWISG